MANVSQARAASGRRGTTLLNTSTAGKFAHQVGKRGGEKRHESGALQMEAAGGAEEIVHQGDFFDAGDHDE
jgi:hypothetical protein